MPSSPIEPILNHLRSRPSRTGSIVVTVFGDAVVPRGGSLWLGSLLEIFTRMGIGGGVVRTAMSRLAAEGWLQRVRISRNSFYHLTDQGRASFTTAARRIYGPAADPGDARLCLLIAGNGGDQQRVKVALEAARFGTIAAGVWIAPLAVPVPHEAARLLRITCEADPAASRELAKRAWPLATVGEAYDRFIEAFQALQDSLAAGAALDDLDCLVARTLLVHEFRRVVLRDPLLPPGLLPEQWPGAPARRLCAQIYRTLLPLSERWLDRCGRTQDGPLPAPDINLFERFAVTVR